MSAATPFLDLRAAHLEPHVLADVEPVWHLFVVQHAERDELQRRLAADSITTLIHYPVPPHRQPAFAEFRNRALPRTQRLADRVLSLPIGPQLAAGAVERVAAALSD